MKGRANTKILLNLEMEDDAKAFDAMHKVCTILRDVSTLEGLSELGVTKVHAGFLGLQFEEAATGRSFDAMPGHVFGQDD